VSLTPIFDQFTAPGTDWLPDGVAMVGPDRIDDSARAPRIAWRPVGAVHTAARRLGGGPGDDGDIMSRQWSIEVDVWGTDLDNTIVLVDAFLAAAHELLSKAGYNGGREVWNVGGVTASGARCVISFQLITPVRRKPKFSRTITEIVGTATLVTS
jgi:hypothetical protein